MTSLDFKYLIPTEIGSKNAQPFCELYDDVYYNDIGGLAETEYVFIHHNQLLERWKNEVNKRSFCIAELGFGTGLNFLTTWHHWRNHQDKPKHLHYISFEKHPLSLKSLQNIHDDFPELQSLSSQLLKQWGNFRAGIQQLNFKNNITLSLVLGDANGYIQQIHAHVDAWYLDGFAPKKNPALWRDQLFCQINRLSDKKTTLSTYTAASNVSKTLSRNGFKVTKVPGFGKKREMITARYEAETFTPPRTHEWDPLPKSNSSNQHVTILGGGIAGLCLAQQFKQAGFHTTVLDQHQGALQQASGNAMAMVMPLLTAQQSPESLFYIRAFEAALKFYQATEFCGIGVKQTIKGDKFKRWSDFMLEARIPEQLLTFNQSQPKTANYHQAGYIDTKNLSVRLMPQVDHWITTQVAHLQQNKPGQWQLFDVKNQLIHQTDLLIIAGGMESQKLLNSIDLSLIAKHGQTSLIQPPEGVELDAIQLDRGYVIPHTDHNQWLCGSTFDHVPNEQDYQQVVLAKNHWHRNLSLWQGHPLFTVLEQAKVLGGHAAIRATTADHLPICGPVIDQIEFKLNYQDLHHGRHWQSYPPARAIENLYVLSGLGSRGFTSAPLLSQYLCAMILGEPLPLEADLCKIIHPNRFLYRSLKKPNQ